MKRHVQSLCRTKTHLTGKNARGTHDFADQDEVERDERRKRGLYGLSNSEKARGHHRGSCTLSNFLVEGAIVLSVTISGGALFAS